MFGKGKLLIELISHCLNFDFSLPLELLRRLSCSKQAVYVFRKLACFLKVIVESCGKYCFLSVCVPLL